MSLNAPPFPRLSLCVGNVLHDSTSSDYARLLFEACNLQPRRAQYGHDMRQQEANGFFFCGRPGNAAGTGVRNPQELHLPSGALDSGGDAQGGQGASRMGLEYWQTDPTVINDRQPEGSRDWHLRSASKHAILSGCTNFCNTIINVCWGEGAVVQLDTGVRIALLYI